jgi:cell division protein FtsA
MAIGDILAVLDIGTTKVVALIASPNPQSGNLDILGIGAAINEGLRKGVVINIDKTVKAISQAVSIAEQQAGVKMEQVDIGISGDHIQSMLTRSIIAIPNASREISHVDVQRIIDDAMNVKLPADRQILHILPQEYIIDGQDGVTDPIGMSGVRMESNVHVITGLLSAIQNLTKCIERANLQIRRMTINPIASSNAVLDEDEKEVGVAMIDIGGGTTDITIFKDSVIRNTSCIPLAGNQITEDISAGLGILYNQAERLKRDFGHATVESILHEETIMVPGISGRNPLEINKSLLARIIGPRLEEIFEHCFEEFKKSGYIHRLPAGIVLTGGSSLLHGTDDLASRIFGMPVKLGIPNGMSFGGFGSEIEHPMFSTSIGLLLNTDDNRVQNRVHNVETPKQESGIQTEPAVELTEKKEKQSIIKKFFSFFDEL